MQIQDRGTPSQRLANGFSQRQLMRTGEHELTVALPRIHLSLNITEQIRQALDFVQIHIALELTEKGLKVLFGFWLDQDVDYHREDAHVAATEAALERTVRTYRNHPALLGWCLGNEVWGMLHNAFAQPYLTRVRQAHVLFVERLARIRRAGQGCGGE